MPTWHATVGYTTDTFTEDEAFDVLEALTSFGAAMSVDRDLSGASVSLDVTALDAVAAAAAAVEAVRVAVPTPIEVVEVRAVTPDIFDAELAEPLYPEVVSNAEIAKLAGVTRQRAHQLAKHSSFPVPVIETGQGSLYHRAAVERWLEARNKRPGRPRK